MTLVCMYASGGWFMSAWQSDIGYDDIQSFCKSGERSYLFYAEMISQHQKRSPAYHKEVNLSSTRYARLILVVDQL